MRLPDIRYDRPVQSLGREDVNAPLRVANAQANAAQYAGAGLKSLSDNLAKFGGFIRDQEKKSAKHEAEMAMVRAAKEMQDKTAERLSKGSVPPEELPESLRNEADIADDGDVMSGEVSLPYSKYAVEIYDNDTKVVGKKYAESLESDLAREAFELMWAKSSVRARGGVVNDAVKLARSETAFETIEAIDELVKQGESETALTMVRERVPDIFSPKQAQELINKIKYDGAMEGPRQAMMEGDLTLMEGYLREVTDPEYDGPLSDANRLALSRSLESRIEQVHAAIKKVQSKETAQLAAALKIGVDNGSISHSELLEAFDADIISRSTYISWSSQLNNNIQKNVASDNEFTNFSNAIANNIHIDDSEKKTRTAINKFWKEELGGTYDAAKIMAVHTNVIPTDATHMMLADSNSGDDQKVLEAAQFYLDISQAVPGGRTYLFRGVEGDHSAMLRATAANIEAGIADPVGEARRTVDIEPTAKAEVARSYPKAAKDNAEWLVNAASGDDHTDSPWTFGAPRPPFEMMGEFERMVRNNYTINGGDIDKARSAAFRELTSRWRTTTVSPNGEQILMKHAPEHVLGLPANVISRDLALFTREVVDKNEDIHPRDVFIQSDAGTDADPVRNGWPLMYVDEFGGVRQLTNELGAPVRYAPSREGITTRRREAAVHRLESKRRVKRGEGPQMIRDQWKGFAEKMEEARE